ncbi:SPOR domain-containing protein [Xylophilus rhododendri]|uniref:SPOR domain-containing protein n=1 Tax=Xylophilus rhododendri TaxID=2697032 RepID=A0A857J280_9BURK|nr:SPOR domain-containing protein [Xylophilus rhododendri]QHI98020.1 SPOR domain-containing protein [Xylophilus rhododendri]
MALFNLRWPGRAAQDDGKRSARQRRAVSTESVDALRRRARHRLIGAAVLLVAGIVGFPLLFDTQPRPIPVDIPIVIPERGQSVAAAVASASPPASAPAAAPAKPAAAAAPAVNAPATKAPAGNASTADSLDKGEEIVASVPARPEKAEKPEKPAAVTPIPLRPPAKPVEPHREAAAPAKPAAPAVVARDDDAARARALLDGKPVATAAAPVAAPPAAANADARFVVQVGAFGDAAKAQEARAKLTRGGLQTYVQSVNTKDGVRIRVRVGPFANKAEADRAAAKVKGLDLPASILTL